MRRPPEEIQLVGQSRSFLDLLDQVSRAAPLDRPVLIIGERGTGKELIAARLHFLSRRWGERFVKLNCAAIPETLIESELFGYEAGAFTGARARRAGRFELADEGSLFLDEIANLSQAAQEKLLRIIEYGQFERVGGDETISTDVRVIGATNVDLPSLADAGGFRHDLLDRLAFLVLTVPPLRARRSDIMELAHHFVRGVAQDRGWDSAPAFAPAAEHLLYHYAWPGNVRELKNVVERAAYAVEDPAEPISDIVFDPFDSPWRPRPAAPTQIEPSPTEAYEEESEGRISLPDASQPIELRAAVADVERHLLRQALEANRFHQRDTAGHLGLSYDQLRHALKKHGLL